MDPIEPHHIVAIGASAGGLNELIAFFENTPLDGIAYIVVQHLSADYESRLAEVLSRHSKLVMVTAEEGMGVSINSVYIIPSDQFMTIQGGRLRLSGKYNERAPHLTINTFFNSLAADCGPRSIGVVLSGTGSDGSDGIKAIKKSGGMVVSRDPESTEYSSMPYNAITTGMVDFVVEPEAIPGVIEEYVKRDIELLAEGISDSENMAGLIELISEQLPLDFSDYKQATILRRIKRRAAYNNFDKLEKYLDFAKRSPKEIQTLAEDFLISVTGFFRDQEAFEYLEARVIPAIIKALAPNEEIRIWVTGCATGEEAYSMAIIVSELLAEKASEHPVKIFATDIDTVALAHASKGIYSETVVAPIPKDRLEKYFVPVGTSYQVGIDLRKMVIFSRHDLVKNPPFCNMHLISCRNVLIYMTAALQQKIYQMLLFGLRPQSYLFLGASETPMSILKSLDIISKTNKIYKKGTNQSVNIGTYSIPQFNHFKPSNMVVAATEVIKSPDRTLDGAINETIFNEERRLLVCIDESNKIVKSYGPTGSFLIQQNFFTNDLTELLAGPLSIAFKTASNKVKQTGQKATVKGVILQQDEKKINVSVSVSQMIFKGRPNGFLVVQFTDDEPIGQGKQDVMVFDEKLYLDEYTNSLEQENKDLKEELAAANERLFSLNENMQSFNEELLSTNEELQSTNEEMLSINEELHTLNSDYLLKNKELSELNDDLNNYFRSNTNGQLFVSSDLRLVRFSPGTVRHINLLESDIGRPITNISTNFRFETLSDDIAQVIRDGVTIMRELQDNNGKWYQVMTMAYIRQLGSKRSGAILTFNDITALKEIEQELNEKNELLSRTNSELRLASEEHVKTDNLSE